MKNKKKKGREREAYDETVYKTQAQTFYYKLNKEM